MVKGSVLSRVHWSTGPLVHFALGDRLPNPITGIQLFQSLDQGRHRFGSRGLGGPDIRHRGASPAGHGDRQLLHGNHQRVASTVVGEQAAGPGDGRHHKAVRHVFDEHRQSVTTVHAEELGAVLPEDDPVPPKLFRRCSDPNRRRHAHQTVEGESPEGNVRPLGAVPTDGTLNSMDGTA